MTTQSQVAGNGVSVLALPALCAAQFMIALDYSIIYVALPTIATDLSMTEASAQWIASAYAIFFAGFLLVGGRLADRFGTRKAFVLASVLFGVFSLLGGFAQNDALLLIARGGQGISAALLQPAVLGLLSATFDGTARARAVAVWGAVGASGLAVGVVLGGVLTAVDWRWTLLINVPIAAVAIAGAILGFAKTGEVQGRAPIPLLGAAAGTVALLSSVFLLTIVAEARPDPVLLTTAVVVTLVSGTAFLLHERSGARPLIDRAIRKVRTIRLGSVATAFYMASVGAEFYLVTLLLQQVHGYAPLMAGLGFLPLAALVTIGNMVAGRLIPRFTSPRVLFAGFAISAAGLALLALTGTVDSYAAGVLPGLLLSGLGHGIVYTSMFSLGTSRIPAGLEGGAGAVLTTSQYLSSAVSVAILTIVLAAAPAELRFLSAFAVTTAFAVAGMGVAIVAHRDAKMEGTP